MTAELPQVRITFTFLGNMTCAVCGRYPRLEDVRDIPHAYTVASIEADDPPQVVCDDCIENHYPAETWDELRAERRRSSGRSGNGQLRPRPLPDSDAMKTDLVSLHADHVESLIDSGGVFSLRIEPGDTLEQRQAVIDHGGSVLNELRRRGYYDIRATVQRFEDGEDDGMGDTLRAGEYFVIGFAKDDGEEDDAEL